MYIYFDRTGKIKEVVNDEALRQGNYGVNKLYIYIDRNDVASIDITYLLPSQLIVGPQNYTNRSNVEIPFDQKRDLYWFKYYQKYNFFVIDLEEDINGNGPLDQAGLVHCDMSMNLTGGYIYTLGELNFSVELNSTLNQNQVATQEYLSLSNYLFLRSINVPYTGATKDLILGNHRIAAQVYEISGIQAGIGKTDDDLIIYNNDGNIDVDCYGQFKYRGSEVATQEYVQSQGIDGQTYGRYDLSENPRIPYTSGKTYHIYLERDNEDFVNFGMISGEVGMKSCVTLEDGTWYQVFFGTTRILVHVKQPRDTESSYLRSGTLYVKLLK